MKHCPICETIYPLAQINCEKDGAVLVASRDLQPGTLIRNKYRIERMLGRGGMGTVYLARHLLLKRDQALKFISHDLSHDSKLLKRFFQEAQATIELRHPNVVQVMDLDQSDDGTPYIAMEYVDGLSLRLAMEPGGMVVERAIAIAHDVALALQAAHEKGIIHRDVKPENILLAKRGNDEAAKLLDFGISAILEGSNGVSRTRGLMLTPEYAAPEQWKGLSVEEMDGRVDLYALGGVLYEMLTGGTCFEARNTQGWLLHHLQGTPKAPSELRSELLEWDGLDALVMKLLAKDAEERPATAEQVVRELQSFRRRQLSKLPAKASNTVVETPHKRNSTLAGELPTPIELTIARSKKPPMLLLSCVTAVLIGLGGFFGYRMLHTSGPQSNLQTTQNSSTTNTQQIPMSDHSSAQSKQKSANTPGAGHTQPTPVNPGPQNQGIYQPESQVKPGGGQSNTTVPINPQPPSEVADDKRQGNALYAQKRFAEAVPLLEGACKGGDQESCTNLGIIFVMGQGVVADEQRGLGLLNGSCDKNYGPACTELGLLNNYNISGWKDSVKYFTRGCDDKDVSACNSLAVDYKLGHAVDKNWGQAKLFFSKSCAMGDSGACDALKKLHTWTAPMGGLTWTTESNASPITAADASRYCQSLHIDDAQWRLPTSKELQELYNPNESAPCGGLMCHIDPSFMLTSSTLWSSDAEGPQKAAGYRFLEGKLFVVDDEFTNARAICVKW